VAARASSGLALLGLLYFCQGLPGGFLAVALPVILRERGLSMAEIGLASLLSLPWMLKVLWAPLVDRWWWPRIGRRRSWMIPAQLGMLGCTLALAAFEPEDGLYPIVVLFLALNVFAATQDIPVDGYAVDVLRGRELGLRAAASRLMDQEADDESEEHAGGAREQEDPAPPYSRLKKHAQAHAEEVAHGLSHPEDAVDPAAEPGLEVVRGDVVDAGVAGVVDPGARPGDHEHGKGAGERAQRRGCAPEERGEGKEASAAEQVEEHSPQRVADGPYEHRAGKDETHPGLVDTEALHDRRGERADEELVRLVEQDEDEERGDDKPPVTRRSHA